MQPKILKTSLAEYIPAPYFGKNASGCKPIGDRVLIRPDIAAGKTSGNVQLTDDLVNRLSLSSTSGVIVELGDTAFKWSSDRTRLFEGEKPKTGDRIYFDQYAGKIIRGRDGNEYRLMDDASVGGVQVPE